MIESLSFFADRLRLLERGSLKRGTGTPTSAIAPIWFGHDESNRYNVTPRRGARYDVISASEMKLFAASWIAPKFSLSFGSR
jgi:hypothetical protein